MPILIGAVATNYDQYLGPLFFEPYTQYLSKKWQGIKFKHILELACGTGILTKQLIPLLHNDGTLLATDLNADMLNLAQQKIQDPRIHWKLLDAQELLYDDQIFELVICQFGVMFFADKLKAFKEAFRVLKPGGHFNFLTWDDVVYNSISYETQLILQSVYPSQPPAFSKKGPYSYFNKEEITSTLKVVGFHDIEIYPVPLTGKTKNIDDVLTGVIDGSPIASFLKERGIEIEKVKEQLKSVLIRYKKHEEFHFPMQAIYCSANK